MKQSRAVIRCERPQKTPSAKHSLEGYWRWNCQKIRETATSGTEKWYCRKAVYNLGLLSGEENQALGIFTVGSEVRASQTYEGSFNENYESRPRRWKDIWYVYSGTRRTCCTFSMSGWKILLRMFRHWIEHWASYPVHKRTWIVIISTAYNYTYTGFLDRLKLFCSWESSRCVVMRDGDVVK